jgi:hypothetical protein
VALPLVAQRHRENWAVTLGRADRQGDLFDDGLGFCERSLPENSIYKSLLANDVGRLAREDSDRDVITGGVSRRA